MNDWNKEDFGIRLKKLREERGLSMMAFGAAIGTSASRIKDWEKGKNAPSAAWVAKISERFNVSTDELILGNSKTSKPFKSTGSANVDMLYDKLRENVISDIEMQEQEQMRVTQTNCMRNLMLYTKKRIEAEKAENVQRSKCLRY